MLKKPIWNTIVQIAGKGITVLISLVTTGLITRKLGVVNYGNFILITSLFIFLDAVTDFGTLTIGVREVSKGEKVLGDIINLKIILTGVAWVLGLGVVWLWSGFAGFRVTATVALLMEWLTAAFGVGLIVFQSKLVMEKKILMDILFPLLFLAALLTWKGPITLIWVFVAYIIARIISMMPGWWMLRGYEEVREIKLKWNGDRIKKLWNQTWPMGIFIIMFAAYDRLVDSMMIKHFMGASEVAYYGLAYKVYGVLIQPAYFYVNSIFPIMSSKSEGKRKLFKVSFWLLFLGLAGIITTVTILAPWMINVLAGPAFLPAVAALRILVWGCAFTYIGHLVGFTLIARGGQKKMLQVGIIALIFNIAANLILIPRFGILGAAGVTVATEALDLALMSWFLWKNEAKSTP